jgi:hypothetical protein
VCAQPGAPDCAPWEMEPTTTTEFKTALWGTKYLRRMRHYLDIKNTVYPVVTAESEIDTVHGHVGRRLLE